jgi:phage baseplate assembly protein W
MTTRNARTFSDLDLGFLAHPISKDVTKKYDENAIKQSIKNLILTKNYERPFQSNIGSQVKSLLFEPFSPILSAMIKRSIENTIESFEPRANLLDVSVTVSPDNNAVYVTVKFTIVNTTAPITLDLFLERTR